MKRIKTIKSISVEIPTISTDKEGHLLGGFSAFGVSVLGNDNRTCTNNSDNCVSNSGCSNNKQCIANGDCSDNKTCKNNTNCIHNPFEKGCANNITCINGNCGVTTPGKDDTTESSAKIFLLGGSMLF